MGGNNKQNKQNNIDNNIIKKLIKAETEPLEKRILQLELERDIARAENAHLQQKVGLLERKVDQLDQYRKRLNLLIDGIPFKWNETPDTIRNAVLGEIDKMGLEIDDYNVDRAHRAEQRYLDNNGRWQQPVIIFFFLSLNNFCIL